MGHFKHFQKEYLVVSGIFIGIAFVFFVFDRSSSPLYVASDQEAALSLIKEEKIQHISPPESVKAIYMTSWVAGTGYWREDLAGFIDSTELNAVVIYVKDYTGRISFEVDDSYINELGSVERRIPDIKNFIKELHDKNIYVIARISVFQDPYFVKIHPELAVKKKDGSVWKDYKGIPWIDPAAEDFWAYIVRVARASEKAGFDELNFDYIRFPSDGNMKNIAYDYWDETTPPAEVMSGFFAYLRRELGDAGVPLSADLFGMTTVNYDDLNIGQILENAALYFDYIAPMVYPSHYPTGFAGFKNPAVHPYQIVNQAMTVASERLIAASSTPSKLRPWLQDFDLGADYDAVMIRKQMQAVYDSGLTSWMVWDASNKYTRGAYQGE